MDIRYINDNYQFILRVSTLIFKVEIYPSEFGIKEQAKENEQGPDKEIFNEDESKVLLFNVAGRSFYMLPGGKINELEESIDAIKREIKEELGWENLEYKFLGISEELVNDKGYNNHQINLIYKGIYKNKIDKLLTY